MTELPARDAADQVGDWGYFRAIPDDEVRESKWFSYGPRVVWWVNANERCLPGEVSVHICIDPAHRRRVFGRKLTYAFEIVAELMRAERLVVFLEIGAPVGELLARLGFRLLQDRSGGGLECWARELSDVT